MRSMHRWGILIAATFALASCGWRVHRAVSLVEMNHAFAQYVAAIDAGDQTRVDALTLHSKIPPQRDPTSLQSISDISAMRSVLSRIGPIQRYSYDESNLQLLLDATCDASAPPTCVRHLFVIFDDEQPQPRINSMIAFESTAEWDALYPPYRQRAQDEGPLPREIASAIAHLQGNTSHE